MTAYQKEPGNAPAYRYGDETQLLCDILSDPRISRIAPQAIRNMDLSKDPLWNKSLKTLREEHFGGGLQAGFDRLFRAAESGKWYYPLYSPEECASDPDKEGTNLVYFPSEDPAASQRPYILLVPGGGFVNVWNISEGWPVAAQFNELGYHVCILTYQVAAKDRILDREMEDFARALSLIRAHEKEFSLRWDRYCTCGFSAGGYLVCLWNVPEKGYACQSRGPRSPSTPSSAGSWPAKKTGTMTNSRSCFSAAIWRQLPGPRTRSRITRRISRPAPSSLLRAIPL
ncbi:MAG: hypothetical protein J5859_04550 [Clostridia bacterium]|nr:hypothetical protein [Clostridia bacterium]